MCRRPRGSTGTYTLCPYTTLVRSGDQVGRQRAVLMQSADAHVGALRALVDLPQFLGRGRVDALAEPRIVRDATQQVQTARRLRCRVLRQVLAEEVDLDHPLLAALRRRRGIAGGQARKSVV